MIQTALKRFFHDQNDSYDVSTITSKTNYCWYRKNWRHSIRSLIVLKIESFSIWKNDELLFVVWYIPLRIITQRTNNLIASDCLSTLQLHQFPHGATLIVVKHFATGRVLILCRGPGPCTARTQSNIKRIEKWLNLMCII